MRSGVVSILVVIFVVAAATGGYLVGETSQRITTLVSTSTALSTTTATVATTTFTTIQGTCSPLSGSPEPVAIPVGFRVTVSYEGNWSVSIATFAAKSVNASAFSSACYSSGDGTTTFYVGLANYVSGWNTVLALAHKFGTNGTLTVSANIGNETNSSSTAQSYGSAVTTLSISAPG